jgi:hypothetical protein
MSQIFDNMRFIAESIMKETKDTDRPLLANCQSDLYYHDKDIIENDAVPGDEYVWAIRDSGHGTDLYRLNGDVNMPYLIGNAGENGRYFHVKVKDIGKGDITPVTRDHALDLSKTEANPKRVARRENYYKMMEELIGLKSDRHYGGSYSMANEFYPNEGAVSVAKVSPTSSGVLVSLDQIKADSKGENLGKSKYTVFNRQDLTIKAAFNEKTSYHQIKTPKDGYAIRKEISEIEYNNAMNTSKKSLSRSLSPSL